LFAFDLPSTTENSTAENTNCKHQRQTAGVLSKVLQKSLFHQTKLENLIFTFGVICLAQNIGFQPRVNQSYTVKIYFKEQLSFIKKQKYKTYLFYPIF